MAQLSPDEQKVVGAMRVAHLATSDPQGVPHLVPVCFYYDGAGFYSVLDQKPKRAPLDRLKRVRNIVANPNVALVVDHYQEEWRGLWYVLVLGTASIVYEGEEQQRALVGLREKYTQYRSMDIDGNPVIKIIPKRMVRWGQLA